MTVLLGAFPENVSQEVRDFLDHYLNCSNASSAHRDDEGDEVYFASLFHADGTYDFMGTEAKGHKAIKELRHKLFANIPHRDHRIVKVYSHGGSDLELMALGEVDYVHHDGSDHWMQWAARYVMVKEGETLKFKRVSVFASPHQHEDESEG